MSDSAQKSASGAVIIPDDAVGSSPAENDIPRCYSGDLDHVLIGQAEIERRIRTVARDVHEFYGDQEVTLVCVLKGSFQVFSLLLQELTALRAESCTTPVLEEFIKLRSYENDESTGEVKVVGKDDDLAKLAGRHILIVEDIVDTGKTMDFLEGKMNKHPPKSFEVMSLLRKRTVRSSGYMPRFVGFEIPDRFVVGYGLDYNQYYRNLGCIGVLGPQGIQKYKN